MVVTFVLAAGIEGITDASATHTPSTPWTAPVESTTAPSVGCGPIAQDPTGW